MIVVGSRCGGYDYYAISETENEPIWLGAENDSDIDIFCNFYTGPRILGAVVDLINTEYYFLNNLKNGLSIKNGVAFPWKCSNEVLHIPSNFNFLNLAIRKKLRRKKINWRQFIGNKYQILKNKNKNPIGEITFSFLA